MNDLSRFTASVTVDGRCVQHQEYQVEQADRRIHIRETGTFPDHPPVTALCEFVAGPEGYHSIDIAFHAPDGGMEVSVHRESNDEVAVTMNDGSPSPVPIADADGIIYFDGPNPMFDYVNAVLLMGIQDGETRTVMVNVLEWSSGTVVQCPYTFSRSAETISIRKDVGMIVEAELVLENDGGGIARYRLGKEEYSFAPAAEPVG